MKYKSPTLQEWFAKVEQNKDALIQLIDSFHPAMGVPIFNKTLPITAEGAEIARQSVAKNIKEEHLYDEIPIITQFLNCIESKNVRDCSKILNSTWFGVPESTSAWNCVGFRECVDLLEDVPYEE